MNEFWLLVFCIGGVIVAAFWIALASMVKVGRLEHANGRLYDALKELRARIDLLADAVPSAPVSTAARPAAAPVEVPGEAIVPAAPVEPLPSRPVPETPAFALPVVAAKAIQPPPPVEQPAAAAALLPEELPPAPLPEEPPAESGPVGPRQHEDDPWLAAVKRWLFTGNLVAKLGLVILLIGVSFLLKYVASRVVIPIELRIAAVAAADLVLLWWGWRIRVTRRNIGLPVQGAAIGILMLLTFGSFYLYQLIPGGAAFAVLFVLTVFTCLLAVMQNAIWLALFGIVGGFMAPVLTSTGGGSHVGLFSYYAVLNAGIFAIALRRTWRTLNLAGFAFTFGIGAAWGVRSYLPTDYLSVQLFLLMFILFYTGISLAFATQRQGKQQPYVDATLVFGTPLVGATLQFALVRDMPFGIAFAALGGGLYYTALALCLWRRRGKHFRQLVSSFLTMGVLFGTLAIPMALDGHMTSAAWAAEGAAVVWAGLRQARRTTWLFGLALQLGAWVAFLGSTLRLTPQQAADAHLWLGFLILAASAAVMARRFQRQDDVADEDGFGSAGAVLWWIVVATLLAGAWTEIGVRIEGTVRSALLAGSALLLSSAVALVGPRLRLSSTRGLGLVIQLLAGIAVLDQMWGTAIWWPDRGAWEDQPVVAVLLIASSALVSAWRLRRGDDSADSWSAMMLVWAGVWWFGQVLNIAAGPMTDAVGGASASWLPWRWPAYALSVAASSLLFCWGARLLAWPQLRWLAAACWLWLGLAIASALLALFGGGMLAANEWSALFALLLVSEYLLVSWRRDDRQAGGGLLAVHLLRSAGPWLMIWPTGYQLVVRWLAGPEDYRAMLMQAGWDAGGLWGQCLPLWLQMGVIAWLLLAARRERWPVAPFSRWYTQALLPLGTAWCLVQVVAWNLLRDGSMAPLPYLPVLNPVDLSTAFVAALVVSQCRSGVFVLTAAGRGRLCWLAGVCAFAWLNLMLLRTAAHMLGLPYQADALFASRTVEAMLSLVWTASALILMRFAARRIQRGAWLVGALVLALVVAKLFIVDLNGSGSMERIVSFLGVGLLMLAIGYLAPFPTPQSARGTIPNGEAA